MGFASGFARRTRFIFLGAISFIISGFLFVGGMIWAPNETAEIFPFWIGAGALVLVAIIVTFAVLSHRERKAQQRTSRHG